VSRANRIAGVAIAVTAAACIFPPLGQAVGGRYAVDGGTAREQREVVRALEVSEFDWDLVPRRVDIHIERGTESRATRGEIWLDANLLDAGVFAWGVVQHEYAHQVDFLLLDDADRALLLSKLGGETWCSETADIRHAELGCERFASTLAWAYWPSVENCMRPSAPGDESAAMAPGPFRALVSELIRRGTRREQRRKLDAQDGR
jgi:hypothetical protein